MMTAMARGDIRVGIGGWTYPPWRGPFYPPGLRQADELAFAASRLGAIEINGTAYRLQKAESFAKWAEAVPPGFAFTIKASYFCTNRKILSGAQGGIDRFFAQGLHALGDTLGPILWQFAPTKAFDRADFARFLSFLPRDVNGQRLRHAIEVRPQRRKYFFRRMEPQVNQAIQRQPGLLAQVLHSAQQFTRIALRAQVIVELRVEDHE